MVDDWRFVSIIVPVYNGSRTIDALLTSLLALDYPADRHEILIVDNKSTDDTRERIRRYPVTLLEETEIQSSYAARNRGIEAAKGEILAFTDADCVVEPTWLKRLLADHGEPRWGGFLGNLKPFPPGNLIERYYAHMGILNLEHRQGPYFHADSMGERLCSRIPAMDYRTHMLLPDHTVNIIAGNVAFKRIALEEIGYFDQWMTGGGDADLGWRLQTQTDWQIAMVPEAIVYHRNQDNLADLVSVYRRYGHNYATLALKYGNDPERIAWQLMAESLLLMVLTVPSHLLRILIRPLEAINRRPDILFWAEPVLALLCALYHHYGKLEGLRRRRQWMERSEAQPATIYMRQESEGKAF